jgi:hypothetical protein
MAVVGASPAAAQFQPSTSAVGEQYKVEAALSFWNADPTLIIASESLGIPGTDVDLTNDLGIEQKRLTELRVVLRPATKHKFRFHYMPIKYEAEATVQREFIFNGQRYRVGLPVHTTANFTTYRFGYEYDFLYRQQGYIGVLIDLKYTNASLDLDSPIGAEFTEQGAPIPSFGVVGRGYLVSNVSITGEVTFFKIPENLSDEFGGRYFDYDFYGTFNFTNNVGAQLGLRKVDVEYLRDLDHGDLTFTGWYIAGVVRF